MSSWGTFDDDEEFAAPPAVRDVAPVVESDDDMDDPTFAPVVDDSDETATELVADADAPDEDDGAALGSPEWTSEHGFPDATNSVRIWVGTDGLPERVRVSRNWKEKLGDAELGAAVTSVFIAINHHYRMGSDVELPELDGSDDALPYSVENERELLAQWREAITKFQAYDLTNDLIVRYTERDPITGSDFEDGVVITVDDNGFPSYAQFDPEWIKDATHRELSQGILFACKQAVRKFTPPEVEVGEAGRALQRVQYYQKQYEAMLRANRKKETTVDDEAITTN